MHLRAFALTLPVTDVERGGLAVRIHVTADEVVAWLEDVQDFILESHTLHTPPAVDREGKRSEGFSREHALCAGEELKIEERRAKEANGCKPSGGSHRAVPETRDSPAANEISR